MRQDNFPGDNTISTLSIFQRGSHARKTPTSGSLFMVVAPSGAGKSTWSTPC
jgi:reverse gyrase